MKKRLIKLIWRTSLILLFFAGMGCEKTDDGSYAKPITRYEKIMGKWKLSAIKEIDEIAFAQGSKSSEMVLTSKFKFNTMEITFNVDSTNEVKPTTYVVTGEAPAIFDREGYWDMDQAYAHSDGSATIINLYSDAAKTQKTDKFALTTVPGTKKVLEIKLLREINGVPFLSYSIQLKPAVK